ncbi:MAG TPA: hypothetical protein VEK33_19915 [Terriglobales bacterium]|nr:hypothetical protein [Terriglobales bacterium]
MVSERALYWIAVGLMAGLLGNHFANPYARSLRAANQGSALALVQRVVERAASFAPLGPGRSLLATRFASLQAQLAHQQAACARLEAERARTMAIEQIESGRVRGICPRPRVRITAPEPSLPREGTI